MRVESQEASVPTVTAMSEEELIRRLAGIVAESAATDFRDKLDYLSAAIESPIERVLIGALIADKIDGIDFSLGVIPFDTLSKYRTDYSVEYVGGISPQASFDNKYRADIYFHAFDAENGKEWFRAVIECDGHDFHERTPEQASRDKRRDRFFQTKGIIVLRFTGSDIWRHPTKCAEEIYETFWAAYRRRWRLE